MPRNDGHRFPAAQTQISDFMQGDRPAHLIPRWQLPILLVEANPVERQTVSIMKACEMVGVSRRTIYNWIAANKVEYLRTAGGSIRIFVDTLWREPDGTKHPNSPDAVV